MQRLLQGDVGSGKTVVALYALLRAVESGRQGALMAPTETLAEQHFLTLEPLCAQLGVRCVLLTGSVGSKKIRDEIANGVAQIAVGTHALIQRDVEFADLAVAVVDEQHRFGVEQRTALAENRSTHVLHMTATPIPRTLALTIYGDLAVSEIAKPPANRKPIITAWVGAERSSEAYTRLRVAPRRGPAGVRRLPADRAVGDAARARRGGGGGPAAARGARAGYRVGLLHGRLKTAERREVMRAVQGARARRARRDDGDRGRRRRPERDDHDRAGGGPVRARPAAPAARPRRPWRRAELLPARSRGPKEELTETAQARLQALVDTTDGFELAERDLDLRGEGQLLGTRQSGLERSAVHAAAADRDLIEHAREIAGSLRDEDGPWQDEADRMSGDADHRGLA